MKMLWKLAQELAKENFKEEHDCAWEELEDSWMGDIDKYEREYRVHSMFEKIIKDENNLRTNNLKMIKGEWHMRDTKTGNFYKATETNNNTNTTLNKEKENKTMKNTREMREAKLQEMGIDTTRFFNLSLQVPFNTEVKITVGEKEVDFYEVDINSFSDDAKSIYRLKKINDDLIKEATDNYVLDGYLEVDKALKNMIQKHGIEKEIKEITAYYKAVEEDRKNRKKHNDISAELNPLVYLADDPIAQSIMEQGYVNNHRLFRRFVLAHTMRMLNYQAWGNTNRKGWEACMKDCFAYEYQFKMMMDEFKVLYKLQKEDIEAFKERTHFFNGNVLVATMEDYLYRLKKYIDKTRKERKRTYKGEEYVKLARYGNVLIKDLDEKVYKYIHHYINTVKSYAESDYYYGMYKTLVEFMDTAYNKLPYDTTKCSVWKDAYKASGAFYSLQNMIRFHNCLIKNCDDKYESEQHLYDLLDVFKGEEWRFHKVLVDTIERNNFNLNESIRNGNNAIGTSSYDKYNK